MDTNASGILNFLLFKEYTLVQEHRVSLNLVQTGSLNLFG